jgi:hypothetical protein
MVKKFSESVYIGLGTGWLSIVETPTSSTSSIPADIEEVTAQGGPSDGIEIASWGSDNKLPFQILEDVKAVTVAGSGMRKRARVHFGRGVVAFKRVQEEGGETIVPADDQNWKDFARMNNIQKFMKAQITDYEIFNIAFPEYILDNSGNSILQVFHKTAPYIRLSVKEDIEGVFRIRWAVFSHKWEEGTPEEEDAVAVPFLDPSLSVEEAKEFISANGITKFIRPVVGYMPAADYYPTPFWYSARTSGWMELAKLIPKIKQAIIQNSMTLKYLVKIPVDYFKKKYPDSDFTPQEREVKVNEDLKALDDFLKDFENTGKSIVTYFDHDKVTRQKIGAWEIEVIDNKIKDGALNLDSAAANSEILFAIGIDPSLIGSGMPGKELGAKSGSDKREAYNIAIADAMPDRMDTLDTLRFIAEYNGWDPEIEFAFEDNILTTLDNNPTGMQKRSI